MVCTDEQIANIIKSNPQKLLVADAKDQSEKLMMLIHGHRLKVTQDPYFENPDVYKSRSKKPVSNQDLFGRLFQREQMVFSAQGGTSYYTGLSQAQTAQLNAALNSVKYSFSLRKWIQSFALPAFRCDPMGVIFIELDSTGNAYPTYKSISSIYDYLPNGRQLEYICFKLTKADCDTFGIVDDLIKDQPATFVTNYYRFVDDAQDVIYKYDNGNIQLATLKPGVSNPVVDAWKKTPGFIVSNIISFENVNKFLSPVSTVMELAECYMNDRSIRDLQKKYHGFLKAIEPLLQCGICEGSGFLSGAACPECTPAGSDKGTGYKLRTKVADVARFPIKSGVGENFDFNKYFGYVKLPIDVWQQQDRSLNDIEKLIRDVYWGTDSMKSTTGPQTGDTAIEETATKTLANLQPIYARLNIIADWAENTENLIANFIGKFMFKGSFKTASITYGRYYILETPFELMEEYLQMKEKGASQSALFAALKRFLHSMYATNPEQLAVELKLINVEPFVHSTVAQVQANDPAKIDYIAKLYFGEWRQLQSFDYLLATTEQALRDSLIAFAKVKMTLMPEEPITPAVAIAERIVS
jgi:hypothetical protein